MTDITRLRRVRCPREADNLTKIGVVNLAELFESARRQGAGSLRDMEQRAAERGTPISRSTLSNYANGSKAHHLPAEEIRAAIANALGVRVEVVTAAAMTSVAPQVADEGRSLQRAEAWLRLTEGRTDDEVEHLLAVARAALQAINASRSG